MSSGDKPSLISYTSDNATTSVSDVFDMWPLTDTTSISTVYSPSIPYYIAETIPADITQITKDHLPRVRENSLDLNRRELIGRLYRATTELVTSVIKSDGCVRYNAGKLIAEIIVMASRF